MVKPEAIARIEAAIAAVETRSRAELVAMIAPRASQYRATGLIASALTAFGAGAAAWLFLPWATGYDVLLAELIVFPAVLALLELTSLGDRLTPRAVRGAAAARLARAAFLEQGLAGTPERNGVLFFVSLAEHHVEIIADRGIDGRVDAGRWQQIVDAFTAKVKSGEIEAGFVAAIEEIGALLEAHFPRDGQAPDTLPNRLIVLPA
jgi:putative membrane protein